MRECARSGSRELYCSWRNGILPHLLARHGTVKKRKKEKKIFKGALNISLYESNTLQEQDATIFFLSVIP